MGVTHGSGGLHGGLSGEGRQHAAGEAGGAVGLVVRLVGGWRVAGHAPLTVRHFSVHFSVHQPAPRAPVPRWLAPPRAEVLPRGDLGLVHALLLHTVAHLTLLLDTVIQSYIGTAAR